MSGVSELFFACIGVAINSGSPRPLPDSHTHEFKVGDVEWKLEITGAETTHATIPPMHALIWRNGLPAALVGPRSGTVTAGSEDQLIQAMKDEAARLGGGS